MFGLIGRLPAASLETRCLSVLLKRKRQDERVARLRQADAELCVLRTRAVRWGAVALAALREADPELPACLYNRDQDNWRPLIAVADMAGEHWPQTAREIAQAMSGLTEDSSEGVMLLADIRRVFGPRGMDRLDTKSLIAALCDDQDRPWHDFRGQGCRITEKQLAALLRLFDIRSKTMRIGGQTPKGYMRAWSEDAFERYLPPLSDIPATAATPATA